MRCLNCDELKDKAYVSLISKKLTNHFSVNPCVDCGETRVDVLVLSDWNSVMVLIADQEPWPKINAAIHQQEVVCANCHQLRLANSIGSWGVPTKKWES